MKILKAIACLLFMLIGVIHAAAQEYSLRGTVEDSGGEPLIGASVIVKGTKVGAMTDIDGRFVVKVKDGQVITVTYVGYVGKEVAITGQNDIKVVLEENSNLLEAVVVVGYGTARKKDLTGAVTQINPDKLGDQNLGTVQNILHNTAGLAVSASNDAKGGGTLQLRGQNSVYTGGNHNSPLIILDGMDFYGELSEINPNDIAQIDVLKDASAAAVYGARAASGVIIITTKKGNVGKPVITINANVGFSQATNRRKVWSAGNYMDFRKAYYKSATYGFNEETGAYEAYQTKDKNGNPIVNPGYYDRPEDLGQYGIDLDTWLGYSVNGDQSMEEIWARRLNMGENTETLAAYLNGFTYDWFNEGWQTAFNQDYTAAISGATERVNYYLSFGYLNNQGNVKGDYYHAYRANMKLNAKITNWLEVGGNINFQDRSDDAQLANWSGMQSNNPFAPKYDENGELRQYPQQSDLKRGVNYDFDKVWDKRERGYQVLNTIFNAKVTLPFGFTYNFNISPRYQYYQNRYWTNSEKPDRTVKDSHVDRNWSKNFDWSLNNIITWDKEFNNLHHFVVTLVQEAEERKYWSDGIAAYNILPTDALGFHNTQNATKEDSNFSTNDTHQSADALMARVFYGFDNRYMLTASIRRDGYSAFGLNNPHATFPSLALAWRFTNEKFWKWHWMDDGKLRISWGKNGNRSLANEYIALSNLASGAGKTQGYLNESGGVANDMKYLSFDRMANPNLQWEKTEALNIGLDFSFLNSRITGSIDFYDKNTHDMIMSKGLPKFAGFESITTNLGKVNNRGVEITVNSRNIDLPNIVWTTQATFSYNRNRIKHLYYEMEDMLDADGNVIGQKEMDDTGNRWFINRPINQIWDFKMTGIWQVEEAEEAAKYGQRPGDPKVANVYTADDKVNADGTVTPVYNEKDKVFLGETTPPIMWSLRNDFTIFKNLDFGFTIYSKMGHKRTSTDYLNAANGSNSFTYCFNSYERDYWTPENRSNEYARWEAQGPQGALAPVKIHDAGFIRLDNISLGYTLPQKWTRVIGIEKCRFSASVNNVYVWAFDWKYNDPETSSYGRRTFNFGVNLTL